MKNKLMIISMFFILMFTIFGCTKNSSNTLLRTSISKQASSLKITTFNKTSTKHLSSSEIENDSDDNKIILNADGSFGGSYNLYEYGYGSPKNGELDLSWGYYTAIDYYNMGSTATRTMLYHFKPYQKTMENTSGISCLLSLLNYFGYDVATTYSEIELVKRYETLNEVSLKTNSETTAGLVNLINDIGLETTSLIDGVLSIDATALTNPPSSEKECLAFFKNYLKQGKVLIVPYHDGTPGYVMVVGCDDMGTETYYDDLLIFVDPIDVLDHTQDGFSLESSTAFHVWWNITRTNGSSYMYRDYIAITPPESFDVNDAIKVRDDIEVDIELINHYQNHLLIQPDGAYLSTYYTDKFNSLEHNKKGLTDGGSSTFFNSWSNQPYHHENSYYYQRLDYYYMSSFTSNGIYMLNNFRTHVQNMQSTCGICALTNIMNYYGFDTMSESSVFDEAIVASDYEIFNSTKIQGSGTGIPNFKNLFSNNSKYSSVLNIISINKSTGVGIDSDDRSEPNLTFPTYSDFSKAIKEYIKDGKPMAVSWKPCHGHWTVIIGFMDFNNDNPYDDVVIMSDSSDYRDHYFDGYDIFNAMTFYNRWTNSSQTVLQAYYVVERKQ